MLRLIALLLPLVSLVAACGSTSPSSEEDTAPTEDSAIPYDTLPERTDATDGPAWEFTPPTTPLAPAVLAAGLPSSVEGLVFDGAGSLFASGMDGVVYRISPGGTVEAYAELLPTEEKGDVAGMARGEDGVLFVCRYSAGRIELVMDGEPPIVEIFADGLDHPNSLAFAEDGALWYTASGNGVDAPGHLGRIGPGGTPEVLISDIVYANGLAFSPDNAWVWFTSTNPGSLLRAPLGGDGLPSGPAEVVAGGDDLAVADGLAIAPDGTVFVAGFGTGRIYAWHDDALTLVAEDPVPPGIMGVASLAFGAGEGFSGTALYATNLLQPEVVMVELAP